MSEKDDKPESGKRTDQRSAASAGRSRGRARQSAGNGLSVLALLLSLSLLAAAWWAWEQLGERLDRLDQLTESQREQADRLEQLESRTAELAGLPDTVDDARKATAAVASTQAELEAEISRLDQRTEALRDFVDAGRSAWRVAEVEYLLRLATTELQLAGRHDTAMAALEAADERLAALADPALTPVREALASDRERLRATADPDVTGMAMTLASLIERVDRLSFRRDQLQRDPAERPPGDDADGLWDRLRERGSGVLREMVTIRHEDMPIRPLLAPEQEYFLRRNLELKLESARLALLRGQPETWRATLSEARDWLESWYDLDDDAVAAMDEELARLAEQRIVSERPDIARSLERLQGLMEARD
ncbi:uroporphyrinogen-III C-methyltransferase [Gammaproteobacteria bacterium AB-CW1]|uniref:Uroporphyrinogen-III C-methyltransferase n=1 Tax=Natronospira elongata TaxID=3110268 RepID=A0AAP6MLS3_9GAMM|nr:uroporphyrinogen-III C-methyltransferase [Gammaproteobacteria bacterium AB-CW1]